MNWTAVIGLEIHAELLTSTKLFCSCANEFGAPENARCCPGCAAMPGTLPHMNRAAVEMAIAAGLALGCRIAGRTSWDRKNYFYPDLPKAYQNSQLFEPVCLGGGLEIGGRFIRLNRIHLEEDAGKLIHDDAEGLTLVDCNRGGVPLIEIVTEPDIRSADEAAEFLAEIRRALVYAGVNDGKLEQGHIRCDANISVMPQGADRFGTRVEVKNLNSLKSVTRAIEYEISRQTALIESGGAVTQETRRFNDNHGRTTAMRSKEDAQDYRYFPDPDIPPLEITPGDVERVRASLPEPPSSRRERYVGSFGLSPKDADILLDRKLTSDFYDACVAAGAEPRGAANLVINEILRRINLAEISEIPISAADFAHVMSLAAGGKLSSNGLKTALRYMFEEGKPAAAVLSERGLIVEEDSGAISAAVRAALAENPAAAAQFMAGDAKVFGFLMGKCNSTLKGKAQPASVRAELERQLGGNI